MFKRLHPFFVIMTIGLLLLLATVVLNDVYRSITRNQPVSYDVLTLLKIALSGMMGAIAGYLAKE